MANVVGILVVLVAVTQISVGDAVDRIRESAARRSISPQNLAQAEQEREVLEEAAAAANERRRSLERDAGQRRRLLSEAERLIDEFEALPERDELRGLDGARWLARVEGASRQLERLEREVAQARSGLLRLGELLRGLPSEIRPKRVRLPDPRPPPAASREISFFCRYGRIVAIDLPGAIEQLDSGMRRAIGREGRLEWEDAPWLINLFDKQGIGKGEFRWSFKHREGGRLSADIRWQSQETGEALADLRAADSDYSRQLEKQSPEGHYLRYYVWSDSFGIYLEARYIAESLGYAVSWQAVDADDELGIEMSGRGSRPRILID